MIQEHHSLTEQQIQHFETFGFLVRRHVFSNEEIDRLNEEFDKHLATIKGDFDQKKDLRSRKWPNWSNLNPETPYIANLLEDPRIYLPTEQLQGEDTVPVRSNANSFRHNTDWHPDSRQRHLRMLKNLVYLQPTTGDRGSLRLIPGSHKSPLFDELIRIGLSKSDGNESKFLKESGMRGEDIPCYIFCSQPGDVITFNQNVWHAAFGGYEDRRNFSLAFYSNPTTAQEEEDLRAQVENAKTISPAMDLQNSQYYHPCWLDNPEGSARRARWIKWLEKWGFIDAMNN